MLALLNIGVHKAHKIKVQSASADQRVESRESNKAITLISSSIWARITKLQLVSTALAASPIKQQHYQQQTPPNNVIKPPAIIQYII